MSISSFKATLRSLSLDTQEVFGEDARQRDVEKRQDVLCPVVDKSRVDKSRVDKSRVDKSRVDKSRVDKSRVDKSRMGFLP
jgi:hypothetical protein